MKKKQYEQKFPSLPVDNELFSWKGCQHSCDSVEALIDHNHKQKAIPVIVVRRNAEIKLKMVKLGCRRQSLEPTTCHERY